MPNQTTASLPDAYRAAWDRDARRLVNDPERCWDCRLVEACRCGLRWTGLVLPWETSRGQSWGELDDAR